MHSQQATAAPSLSETELYNTFDLTPSAELERKDKLDHSQSSGVDREAERIDQYDWLVERRSEVQAFLLRLYKVASSTDPSKAASSQAVRQLTGVGFSLWRAVFLSQGDRTEPTVREASLAFLRFLIEDNAIGYSQDKGAKEWTLGYYLTDARMRLRVLRGWLPENRGKRSLPTRPAGLMADPRQRWAELLETANAMLSRLEADDFE